MKKLILSFALCCATINFYAQEANPSVLVNEGKVALEAKNYQEAYNKFSAYLTQTNEQDSVIAYNCGVCADRFFQQKNLHKKNANQRANHVRLYQFTDLTNIQVIFI